MKITLWAYLLLLGIPLVSACKLLLLTPDHRIKTIYHQDDRQELSEVEFTHPNKFKLLTSTAIQIHQGFIHPSPDPQKIIIEQVSHGKFRHLCPGERFANQMAVGNCTAFLVSEDELLTAGHCLRKKGDCQAFSYLFDYYLQPGRDLAVANQSDLFHCVQAKTIRVAETDFGYIKLDRPVKNRTPILIPRTPINLRETDDFFTGGYPYGLPAKFVFEQQAQIVFYQPDLRQPNFFEVMVDSHIGMSGAPIFRSPDQFIGLFYEGESDLIETASGCFKELVCKDESCFGSSVLAPYLINRYLQMLRREETTSKIKLPAKPVITGDGQHQFEVGISDSFTIQHLDIQIVANEIPLDSQGQLIIRSPDKTITLPLKDLGSSQRFYYLEPLIGKAAQGIWYFAFSPTILSESLAIKSL